MLSVRVRSILWRHFGHEPTPEEVRAAFPTWRAVRRITHIGVVYADEICCWAGISVPEKVQRSRCPTCGRPR